MKSQSFSFEITAKDTDSNARVGVVHTPHGDIETPAYSPVATKAAVRAVGVDDLKQAGSQVVLANTYHLYLQPGTDVIDEFGGFAPFMNWHGPTITDSGGYQVSFLWEHPPKPDAYRSGLGEVNKGHSVKITDQGAMFRSHIDGSKHLLTPEKSMNIQRSLGADIIMAFDQPLKSSKQQAVSSKRLEKENREAFERSLDWERRSFKRWQENEEEKAELLSSHSEFGSETRSNKTEILHQVRDDKVIAPQALFGIIHGGDDAEYISRSVEMIEELNFPGLAAGGEFIGSDPAQTQAALETINSYRNFTKPLHALGLGGGPEGIIKAVEQGIDLFDNTSITRMARAGLVFIYPEDGGTTENKFRINLTNAQYSKDQQPIATSCSCYTCQHYSKVYLRHLLKINEFLGFRLTSIHNITYIHSLMKEVRESINNRTFGRLTKKWLE